MKMLHSPVWNWIKGGMVVVLIAFWIPLFMPVGIHSAQSFDQVSQTVLAALDPSVYPQQDQVKINRVMGVDPASFTQIALYRMDDAMSGSELVIASFDTEEQGQAFQEAAEKRKTDQYNVYSGYAPDQAVLLENALIDVQGNYALYYVGDNPEAVDETFLNALKGGQ